MTQRQSGREHATRLHRIAAFVQPLFRQEHPRRRQGKCADSENGI